MIFLAYNKLFMKLLEEQEKIERNSVPKKLIRAMFHMSYIGSTVNKEKIIQELVSKVVTVPEWCQVLEVKQPVSK